MAIEHKDITGANIHEPKGVGSATSGQVYVADGSSSGAWTSQDPAYAQGYIENSTASTTISTVDTPVQVNFGGAFNSDLANKFTISVNGAFTYTGSDNIVVHVTGTLTGTQNSASSAEYTFFVAKNGTIIDSSLSVVETDGSVLRNFSLQTVVTLATNDVLTFWVENNSGTTDVTVGDASISVAQLGW